MGAIRSGPATLGIVVCSSYALAGGGVGVKLNEVDGDPVDGFVELYDGGVGGSSLSGLVLVMYDGGPNTVGTVVDLDGVTTDAQGFLVIGQAATPNVDVVIGDAVREGVALYAGDAVDFPLGSPLTLAGLRDAYTNDPALLPLLTTNVFYLSQAGDGRGRCPDGAGAARDLTQWVWTPPTPGAPSACLDVPSFCNALDGSNAFCPCAPGAPDSGCDKPIPAMQGGGSTGGVLLEVVAQQTFPMNRATVTAFGHPPGGLGAAAIFRSRTRLPEPVVFGDGVLCVGSPVVRVSGGAFLTGLSTQTFGHGTMAGSGLFYYQAWLRNVPTSFCNPGAPYTTASGIMLSW